MISRLPRALVLLLASAPARAEVRAPDIRGVLFVKAWEFREPVEIVVDGRRAGATRGVVVGLAVSPAAFRATARLRPIVFADRTAGVYRGGPFGGAGTWFVVVQFPEIDLGRARFWLGPRLAPEQVGPARVAALHDEARRAGRLHGPLAPADLAAARVAVAGPPAATFAEVRASALDVVRRLHGLRVVSLQR